jgi:electron transfer flavoprotein alpha subunit
VTVLLGGEEAVAGDLAGISDTVLWAGNPAFERYEAGRWVDALACLVEQRGAPVAIIAGASSTGFELMPRVAARLRVGYLGSCVALWWHEQGLAARRPVYGGKVYEEVAVTAQPAVITVRAGALPIPAPRDEKAAIEKIELSVPESTGVSVEGAERGATRGVDITEAARVVTGGRGMGSADNFKLLEEIAEVLDAAVGASRAVVDSGWRPHDEQVGKSGKTISPELYLVFGVSGAIHHVLGMNTAKVVAAVNTDPEALIFQHADFGLVGDALAVIPALTEALKGG